VLSLARWGCLIEDHYSAKAGHAMPMDVEWAKDGQTGELFILQARPETVHSMIRKSANLEVYELLEAGRTLLKGRSVGQKIGPALSGSSRTSKHSRTSAPTRCW